MGLELYSVVFGSLGIGFGGFLSLFFKNVNVGITCLILSFASGMMISGPCFEMLPHSIEISGVSLTLIGFFFGIIMVVIFDLFIDSYIDKRILKYNNRLDPKNDMLKSAVIMVVATMFHDIPEGIAIGAGLSHGSSLVLLMGIMLILHNVPIGIAIGGSLLSADFKKISMLLITFFAGTITLVGCLIGYAFGSISEQVTSVSLAVASGAMLYVVFEDILPKTVLIRKDGLGNLFTVFGIAFGIFIISLTKEIG